MENMTWDRIRKDARNEALLGFLKEALFNAASLGYKGECLSFDSMQLDAVLRAAFPDEYVDVLETLRVDADRKSAARAEQEDTF